MNDRNSSKIEEEQGAGKKRKRPVPPPCKCVETVKCLNSMLHDLHAFCTETIVNFPELTGKILDLTQKAINDEIFYPLKILEQQLKDEEKRGFNGVLQKLEKSRRCKAKVHDPEDVLPAIDGTSNVCYESDEEENRRWWSTVIMEDVTVKNKDWQLKLKERERKNVQELGPTLLFNVPW